MTVIENINIAYVSQDLSLLSSADADGTKDLRYLSVFAIGCMILPLREDRRNCLFNGWVNSFRIVLAFFTAWSSYRQSICVSVLFTIFSDFLINLFILSLYFLFSYRFFQLKNRFSWLFIQILSYITVAGLIILI